MFISIILGPITHRGSWNREPRPKVWLRGRRRHTTNFTMRTRGEDAECDRGLLEWEGNERVDRSVSGPNIGESSSGHAPVVSIYADVPDSL